MDERAEWDQRYAESDRVWSGRPNGALITEIAGIPPGRALDVGCGEGADAIWLAQQGWAVTALDVSAVALERARAHATEAHVEVSFLLSGLLEAGLEPASFDVVAALYPALRHSTEHDTIGILLDLVAPSGAILFVHHAIDGDDGHDEDDQTSDTHPQERPHRFNPADYVGVADMRARLNAGWSVEVYEERDRTIAGGGGARHTRDLILRAHRVGRAQPDRELDVLEDDQDVPPRPEEEIADASR